MILEYDKNNHMLFMFTEEDENKPTITDMVVAIFDSIEIDATTVEGMDIGEYSCAGNDYWYIPFVIDGVEYWITEVEHKYLVMNGVCRFDGFER